MEIKEEINNKELKDKIVKSLEPEEIREIRKNLQDKKDELEELGDWEMDERDVDNYIDECYPEVDIAGCLYSVSSILKDIDECRWNEVKDEIETTQREEKQDELESEIQDLEDELEELTGDDE